MVSLIAALARNRTIGAGGRLPWRLPEDLKRFRSLTTGHPVVMGRKTFESIGKPLPDRTNVVVTRDASKTFPGCVTATSLEDALKKASAPSVPGHGEVFVIGGEAVYREALPKADRLYLTLIAHDVDGDAFFPEFDAAAFDVVAREARTEPFAHEFQTLRRR